MINNYFFIDGSALTSQIRILQRRDASFRKRRLIADQLLKYLCATLTELGSHEFKRATFYFAQGDEVALEEWIVVPDFHKPGAVRDIHFKYCGHKLKGSAQFAEWASTVPSKWSDRVSKSEKGVDIELCCDALKLASASRIERLFLFTNDDDFLPLCRTLKEFGSNVSLIHLHDLISPNLSLVKETDSYDVVPLNALHTIFTPPEATDDQAESVVADTAVPSEPKSVGPTSQEDEIDDAAPAANDPESLPPTTIEEPHRKKTKTLERTIKPKLLKKESKHKKPVSKS
jgi:uncharacterized LabA/DUF88 family protein